MPFPRVLRCAAGVTFASTHVIAKFDVFVYVGAAQLHLLHIVLGRVQQRLPVLCPWSSPSWRSLHRRGEPFDVPGRKPDFAGIYIKEALYVLDLVLLLICVAPLPSITVRIGSFLPESLARWPANHSLGVVGLA